MTSTPLPPAGWHVDPEDPSQWRYWDGQQWTDRRSPRSVAERTAPTGKGKASRRGDFQQLATAAAHGQDDALAQLPAAALAAKGLYRSSKWSAETVAVVAEVVFDIASDDVITAEEESRLDRVMTALEVSAADLRSRRRDAADALAIASINSGRMPAEENPPILLKRGEQAYVAFQVELVRERAVREFRGGSQGVSIPIGMGVRYRVGNVRGRSVVVGTELATVDRGALVITTQRAVFAGSVKTLEFRYDKLVGLQTFTDGLGLNVTNRQAASVFRFDPKMVSPHVMAALITRAVSVAP